MLQPSADSNSEVDACTFFLLQRQELLKESCNISIQNPKKQQDDIAINYNFAEKNSECYVLSWVCSRLPH